ncbi:MAG: hypothetical protein N2B06_00510 [Clostridium sp.]
MPGSCRLCRVTFSSPLFSTDISITDEPFNICIDCEDQIYCSEVKDSCDGDILRVDGKLLCAICYENLLFSDLL